jgi:hypothetical protein
MSDQGSVKNIGQGLVGGLIVAGLLDELLSKNVLSLHEVRSILQKAMNALGPSAKTPEGHEAFKLIAWLQKERFPERSQGE